MGLVLVFFFFKQKTAYEMRISDWSSDVCSSDLAGAIALDDRLAFTDADVLDYAPVVKAHRAGHALTVGEACAGAVELSDNSAANLLLQRIGGPAGLTRFMSAAGDSVSRVARYETGLHPSGPGAINGTTEEKS